MKPIRVTHSEALYNTAATRLLEQQAMAERPPHRLMALAGLAVAQLARALAPHARCIWVACGPGNNGGDGLVAATHLHRWAQQCGGWPRVVVTHSTHPSHNVPPDAQHALREAQAAGVVFADEPPEAFDMAIDAVFGIGLTRPPEGQAALWLAHLRNTPHTVLCVDVPSGLDADTGTWHPLPNDKLLGAAGSRHTLALLTLKPGLFTASGRDAAGQVWFDDLQTTPSPTVPPTAYLNAWPDGPLSPGAWPLPHANHKGCFGDVWVLGGQDIAVNGAGMTGAAVLAARAALHAGAGRVYLGLLAPDASTAQALRWDPECPELMFRDVNTLVPSPLLAHAAVVCGCGGGSEVARFLPQILADAPRLVLDADALNVLASDVALQSLLRQRSPHGLTVLTPHPLEAARLLACSTAEVMADRLRAAQAISERFASVCVLKGSGTLICAPGRTPRINPSGNAALATAGTGDVLAGMLGAALAPPDLTLEQQHQRVAQAVFRHGRVADQWQQPEPWHGNHADQTTLTASRLARQLDRLG
jgi:hydroxyethylthiazole kinase-like uncharacterized protein yjeF